MLELLPFVALGLATGSVYGLAGVGLVLTYRTSGIFNFAHGAFATVAAYLFYTTSVLHGWSNVWSAVVAVVVLGPAMGLLLELIARRIQSTTLAVQVATTVGLLLIVQAGATIIYGETETRLVPSYFPDNAFEVAGAFISYGSVVRFALTSLVVVGLSLYLRRARAGIAMSGVVDDPDLLALSATNPRTVRRLAWIIGCTLAAGSGVLFAPLVPLDPSRMTLLVVSAFGAAAIGMFRSLPLTFAGGLLIGVLAAVFTRWFTTGVLSGLSASIPFLVLFAVLIVFPKSKLVTPTRTTPQSHPSWRAPARVQVAAAVACLTGLAFVPNLVGFNLIGWSSALAITIVFLSLSLLVRMSGQVSLCHVTFMAMGAVTLAHLTATQHWPWGLALLASGLIAVPAGAILAIPAIRLGGLYLALATLGFGILVQSMFYTQDFFFGSLGAGLLIPRPSGLESDRAFYYLVLSIVTCCAVLVAAISRSRLGRLLRGLADSPAALETSGVNVTITRVLVFCLSAFLAGIGGALWSASVGVASASSYPPLLSLQLFVLMILLVGGAPWDALIAGLFYTLIPVYVPSTEVSHWMMLLFGIFAVLYGLSANNQPHYSTLKRAVDRLARRKAPSQSPISDSDLDEFLAQVTAPAGKFEASNIRVAYAGVVAVDGVSLEVPTGSIIGLIGPNGAGKTTTFNACSGLIQSASGEITIYGNSFSGLGVPARARNGLGRTFQRVQLFESLTVEENVAFGAESAMASSQPLRHVVGRRGERRRIEIGVEHALELCGLTALRAAHVAVLSTGQRRLVELARCLAGDFRVLLLDEPSSGLDPAETKHFGQILRRVVTERNVGVLLVEHDMSLVLSVCERIYVIDFGKPIFDGTPHEVSTSPVVRSVYLGETDADLAQIEVDSGELLDVKVMQS